MLSDEGSGSFKIRESGFRFVLSLLTYYSYAQEISLQCIHNRGFLFVSGAPCLMSLSNKKEEYGWHCVVQLVFAMQQIGLTPTPH